MPVPLAPILATAIPAALSIGQGLMEGGKARSSRRSANARAAAIPEVDPGVMGLLNQYRQRAAYADYGNSAMANYKRNVITNAGIQSDRNMQRSAGTAPGGAIQAMLRGRQVTARGLAAAGAESEQLGLQYQSMQAPLVSDIADRSLSLRTTMRDRDYMDAAQHEQNANGLIWGGLAMASRLGFTQNEG